MKIDLLITIVCPRLEQVSVKVCSPIAEYVCVQVSSTDTSAAAMSAGVVPSPKSRVQATCVPEVNICVKLMAVDVSWMKWEIYTNDKYVY